MNDIKDHNMQINSQFIHFFCINYIYFYKKNLMKRFILILILVPIFLFNTLISKALMPNITENDSIQLRTHTTIAQVDTAWFWDFNRWNNSMDWMIPSPVNGGIRGGAICLALQPDRDRLDPPSWRHMVWGEDLQYDLISPSGLEVKTTEFTKVRMRILNKSPETDGLVFWGTKESPGILANPVHFAMKPDCKNWQEVVCHMDKNWSGIIDQISIRPAQMWWSGDLWIDWIAITGGPEKTESERPDIISPGLIPVIHLPGISQKGFQDAFRVLDECMVIDVPMRGFNYPFLAPGGVYGQCWWQLDGSLNVAGAKWVNQHFVENIMRGFAEVQAQNPDGRIDLYGGSVVRGQVADVSSIPRFFEAAWDVARRSSDPQLREVVYETMKKYLGYWLSESKRDQSTGLVTAVFEESFGGEGPYPGPSPGIVAAVDLNVAVAIGCYNTSRLAQFLGNTEEADDYDQYFDLLSQSINRYLWNNEKGAYLNYNVRDNTHYNRLICSTFDPMQFGIAPSERIEVLLEKLLNPELFNWGIRPVTSIARTEPDYVEAVGPYDGRAWLGDIWTMRNLPIIKGLEYAGKHDLAAELTWSTIQTFHTNYCEYAVPSNGSGEGVHRYGWTASQYIETIVEHLFGIDCDLLNKRIRVMPHIPEQLYGKKITIENLIIPGNEDSRLSISVLQTDADVIIEVGVSGKLPVLDLEVFVPLTMDQQMRVRDGEGSSLQILKNTFELCNASGIQIPLSRQAVYHFSFSDMIIETL